MLLPLGMLLPRACWSPWGTLSLLGMLLPPLLAAPLQEGFQLGQPASKQVALAHHHFHFNYYYYYFLKKVTV
jgi:hypothetical protein